MNRSLSALLPGANGTLHATLIRGDGTHRDYGLIAGGHPTFLAKPVAWWRSLWVKLRGSGVIPIALCFAAFLEMYGGRMGKNELLMTPMLFGLVTTAGVNFLATDFASGQATPRISAMNFHDSGTGTTAAATGDTALQTQAGPATRATGTQSNPSANVYKSIGTIAYVSTLAITEWGIFNQAAQGGTLWDHRIFSAINVVSGDSIQYSYSLTINAGGS